MDKERFFEKFEQIHLLLHWLMFAEASGKAGNCPIYSTITYEGKPFYLLRSQTRLRELNSNCVRAIQKALQDKDKADRQKREAKRLLDSGRS